MDISSNDELLCEKCQSTVEELDEFCPSCGSKSPINGGYGLFIVPSLW